MAIPSGVRCLLPFLVPLAAAGAQTDWTTSQSPVKNQGRRGTCAAFAICGALETFPGVPGDLSEQLLYASLKLHQHAIVGWQKALGQDAELREGDLFSAYTGLFDLLGTCAEPFLPYDPDPKRSGPSVPDELKRFLELAQATPADLERIRDGFGKYGFAQRDCRILAVDAVRDVAKLKALFDAGTLAIPVGYRVHATNWSNLAETGNTGADNRRLYVHPGMMERFRRGDGPWMDYAAAMLTCLKSGETLVAGIENGTWGREPVGPDEEYCGHAVLLVGYDERGFVAKNSWGPEWGDRGFCRITWDYHRLYAVQGLVIERARLRAPSLNPFETTARIRAGAFRLKVQPRGKADTAHWQLSSWMLEPRDALFERVEYTVMRPGSDGAWTTITTEVADAGASTDRTGAPVVLRGEALAAAMRASAVKVVVRIGTRASADPADLASTTWVRTVEFAPFAPALQGAVDLGPEMR